MFFGALLSVLRFSLIVAALAGPSPAADKPNLSGTWKIDFTRSDFGNSPPPDSFNRKIEHAEPSIVLTDEQVSAMGNDKAVRRYTTDGKETTYQWMGSDVSSGAHWDGETLVIIGKVNSGGTDVGVTTRISISQDGKTLTEDDKIAAGGNEIAAFKIVLAKQ